MKQSMNEDAFIGLEFTILIAIALVLGCVIVFFLGSNGIAEPPRGIIRIQYPSVVRESGWLAV